MVPELTVAVMQKMLLRWCRLWAKDVVALSNLVVGVLIVMCIAVGVIMEMKMVIISVGARCGVAMH